MSLFSITALLGAVLAFGLYGIKRWGALKSELKYTKKERDAIHDQAQDWANAPATDDDFHHRMRKRINKKRKAGNKR